MQFNTIFTAFCLALISGTGTAESTPIMNPMPIITPSQSASPSFTRAPASRSATPTVQPTHPYLTRTAASSVRVSSTPFTPSGFKTSAIPTASSAGGAGILGGLLNLPQQ
ncbi:hypothetical protein PoHVEF18_000541 [Penicillium ochrochloron]